MAGEILSGLIVIGGLCFIFGVAYPLVALICYPLYNKFIEPISLRDYMRNL